MRCPNCFGQLENITYKHVMLDRCARCDGLWFDADEFRRVKDAEDDFLRWIDVDLFKHEERFRISRGLRTCPKDGVPLYKVEYGESGVTVDLCHVCAGMWLDDGEYRAILDYLRAKVAQENVEGYLSHLWEEAAEIVAGPESMPSEFQDFLIVQRLLAYHLFARMPFLSSLVAQLP